METDNTGQVVQLYDYYPFGDVRIDNHATGHDNDYQFTGKERDDDTGLLYYEARYYGSDTSRFISLDPWEGDISDPQSLNQTAYVRNNPLKYVDPSGKIYETPWDIANVFADAVSIVVGGGMYATGAVTGNPIFSSVGKQAVAGGIANLGTDVAATFVPGLPAGATKLDDAARAIEKVSPFDLNRTHSIQGRDARRTVDGYKEKIQTGENVNPVEHVKIGGERYITDGHHRTQAYRELGQKVPTQERSVSSVTSSSANNYTSANDIVQSAASAGRNNLPKPKSKSSK